MRKYMDKRYMLYVIVACLDRMYDTI